MDTDWQIVQEPPFGDWRAYAPDGRRRTRLKRARADACHDAAIGRVQTRIGDDWIDAIDGRPLRMPARPHEPGGST